MVTARNSRADVVAAAGRLFAERGYHGTSMRDLGRELGLHGSSLYSHVTSKEDLLLEVVESGAKHFERAAERALASSSDPAEQLRALIAGHVDVVLDHTDAAKTFLDEARSLDDGTRARIRAARNAYEQRFRDVIGAGVDGGAFRSDLDPKLATIFALSILNALERWFSESGPMSRAELKQAIFEHVHRALGGVAGDG